jgi:hypothetical protein
MTAILATAAPPTPSRLRFPLERPATQHTIMVLLAVFVVEIAARLVVHRAAFWRDPLRLFDFVVVGIALVLLILYCVFAVIATNLFAAAYPDWFGHIGRSLYTLFHITTPESWSTGIARPVMAQLPYAWMFFVVFILVATFTMLNLFIAIIVNAMQRYSDGESKGDTAKQGTAGVREELPALRVQIERSSASLAANGSREGESR